jgi:3-oxoacyl-[acyl-carrier protein] reductase
MEHSMQGVAVVTGASAGIGEAIARRLLDEGHTVVTLQRRPPPFEHERLLHRAVDLSDADSTSAVAREVAGAYPVRYLVNNAGANRPGPLEAVSVEDLDYAIGINVKAAVLLIQAFAPGMREAKFGRIVSMSSRAIMGKTQRLVYSAAKSALIGITRTLSLELARDGITVNAIAPGPVATDLFDNGHPVGSEKRRKVIEAIPVKRVGTPDDVARAVTFLLHADSGYITGQTLFVCGGTSVSGTGGD